MDGLECSEVLFSQLTAERRIDAEYFNKHDLLLKKTIENKIHVRLDDISTVTDGIHTSIDYDETSGINLISATSPKQNRFDLSRKAYISKEAHIANPRTALHENDVVISTVGTIGNCAVVEKNILPANSDRHVGIIRLKSTINPYVLSTFLLTKYGRNQTIRETTGNVQPNLFLYKIREIIIPVFGDVFQQTVKNTVTEAHTLLDKADQQYLTAEQLLENELGVDMSAISDGGVSIKSCSECFNIQNRIDAEFYQPKYDKIQEAIKNYDKNAKSLNEIAAYVFTGECAKEYFTYQKGFLHYIRGTNIHDGLVDVDVNYSVVPDNHSKLVSSGDIVTGRVGTIGKFGVISDELNGAACSDNVLCFRLPDSYQPNVYALYFNSAPIRELTDRMSRGSVQQRLNQETLRELIIPFIPVPVQDQINSQITLSFLLRAKAEQMLEYAKQAVEMAIEKDETTAAAWLEDKIEKLNI